MGLSNQKIMWIVATFFFVVSAYMGNLSYQAQSLPDLDSVQEWDGVLPEYEEMGGHLSGERGTWVKSSFALNEGVIGDFTCYGVYSPWDQTFNPETEIKRILPPGNHQESYNISIIWEDSEDDEYYYVWDEWIDIHPDLKFYGISDDGHGCSLQRARNAFRGGVNTQITVGVEEDPIFLRGLFLILEGENETEEWYLVSVGHDENGGFSVEPSTDDNKWSRAIWSIFWGLIGIFIFHSSFMKENR